MIPLKQLRDMALKLGKQLLTGSQVPWQECRPWRAGPSCPGGLGHQSSVTAREQPLGYTFHDEPTLPCTSDAMRQRFALLRLVLIVLIREASMQVPGNGIRSVVWLPPMARQVRPRRALQQ